MFESEMRKLAELYRQGAFQLPFYAERLRDIHDFDDYGRFTQIPFMYKADIRKTKAFERSNAAPGDVYGIFSSSGTTGDKTFYVYSNKDKRVHETFVRAYFEELGVKSADLGGVFAPVDSGVMAHTMMWQFNTMGGGYVNCPEPSPENMIEFVTKLPITIIATRPIVVCSVAGNPAHLKAARESGVRMLLLGGGFLTEGRRKYIEDCWNADCYSMFGMSEVFGPMGGECRYKDGIHYLDEYLLIEVVNPVTRLPVEPGEYGIAIYTTLWDKGFPLLRYWTDDYIAMEPSPCRCGRNLPRFRYKGRMSDSIEIDGRYIFPSMLEERLFKYGYAGEYRAVKADGIRLTFEKTDGFSVTPEMKKDIDDLFMRETEIQYADKDELAYDGHALRFKTVKA